MESNIYNSNRTNRISISKVSRINDIPVAKLFEDNKSMEFPEQVRFSRQIQKKFNQNNKKDNLRHHIKIMFDLQPKNGEDIHKSYDNNDYYDDYQTKNTNSLLDDWNFDTEIELNSKPITKTLSESQERKRCTKVNTNGLEFSNFQQPQQLILKSNNDRSKSILKCRDCNFLKTNMNPIKSTNNYENLRLKPINYNDSINILEQLIDELNKSKDLQSSSFQNTNKEITVENKEMEPLSTVNKLPGKNINNSSSEEWVLKFEKLKGNHIIILLNNTHPENTVVSGKWVRDKILENKYNNSKPIVIDLRNEFNDMNESISKNDVIMPTNLLAEKPAVDNFENNSYNLNSSTVSNTPENKDTLSSLQPEKNEHFLVTRETLKPLYLLSTSRDMDNSMIVESDKWKPTTKIFIDNFNKDNHSTYYENDSNNQENASEPSVNNYQTTPYFELNEELASDLSNSSEIKNLDGVLESNIHVNNNDPKIDHPGSVIVDTSLVENDNYSSENDINCRSCDKKVIKNILSSTLIKNMTKIETDTYLIPNSSKMKSKCLSDRTQKYTVNNESYVNTDINTRGDIPLPRSVNTKIKSRKPVLRNDMSIYKQSETHLGQKKYNNDLLSRKSINNGDKIFSTSDRYSFIKNTSDKAIERKNKNKINLDGSKKELIYKILNKSNLKKPRVDTLREPLLVIDDDQVHATIKNKKSEWEKSSFKNTIPKLNFKNQLKLEDQNKKNYIEKLRSNNENNNNRVSLIPKYLPQKNLKILTTKLKKEFKNIQNTNTEKNIKTHDNMDDINVTKKISKTPKQLTNKLNKIIALPQIMSRKSEFNDNIIRKSLKKETINLEHESTIKSKTFKGENNRKYNTDDVTLIKMVPPPFKNSSQVSKKESNKSSLETVSHHIRNLTVEHDNNVLRENPKKLNTELHEYVLFNPHTNAGENSKKSNSENKQVSSKIKNNNNNGLVFIKLRKFPNLEENNDDANIKFTPKNTNEDMVYINTTEIPMDIQKGYKRITSITDASKLKNVKYSKLTDTDITPIENHEIATTLKLKKSLNDGNKKNNLSSLVIDQKIPTQNNPISQPIMPLKKRNYFNDEISTESSFIENTYLKPNVVLKNQLSLNDIVESKSPKVSQIKSIYDPKYAHYKTEDLKPIKFTNIHKIPTLTNENSRFYFQNPFNWQTLFGNKFQFLGFRPFQAVPIIRPEYDDYYDTWRNDQGETDNEKNKHEQTSVQNNNLVDDNIPVEFLKLNTESLHKNLQIEKPKSYNVGTELNKYDINDSKKTYLSESKFEILPQIQIVDGVFKIPLVGQKKIDNRRNEYISDIFIPIEKLNGQHSGISLTDLLKGDLRLFNGYGEHPSTNEPAQDINSMLTSISTDRANFDVSVNEPPTPKTVQANKEKEKPVLHVIQIINNGLCSNISKISEKIENNEGLYKVKSEDKRISSTRQAVPVNRKIDKRLEKAYKHFDSEIMDKFLKVYDHSEFRINDREKKSNKQVPLPIEVHNINVSCPSCRSKLQNEKLTNEFELNRQTKIKDLQLLHNIETTTQNHVFNSTKEKSKHLQKDNVKKVNEKAVHLRNLRTNNKTEREVIPTIEYEHYKKPMVKIQESKLIGVDITTQNTVTKQNTKI